MGLPTMEISEPDIEVGQRIGEYDVDGKLGQGAFGTVYRATHPLIGKIVAIKVLARRFSVDPEMVSRFIAEAKAVNQIGNRHIIDIFSFGKLADGRQYYVMEYLDGEPLDATLEREGRLSLAQALPIFRAIAKALDAAHGKGIAHRDLKCENVFLGRDPDGSVFPKLLDFGIAKLMASDDALSHKTRTGAPIGTPYYMSPEQSRGRDVDHRTDIYAFGVLVYVVLVGKYPFDGDDYMSILLQQIGEQPEPASTRVPGLPVEVDGVISWLMMKDPADRPANLKTAMRALEDIAIKAGLAVPPASGTWDVASSPSISPLSTRPPALATAATTMPAPRRRVPVVAVIGAAALLAAAAAVFVATRGSAGEPAKPPVAAIAPAPAPAPVVAPAPAPAPVPVPAPPRRDHVIVTITGVPEGTDVSTAGTSIGIAPGPVQLPIGESDVVLTFKADGYLPSATTVRPDQDRTLAVQLKAKPRVRATRSTKDDIIDIKDFGGSKP